MDKMTFASYKFKPSDVIEGLNRYFAETKANRYLRASLEIRNGVWTSNPDYRKDVVFTNSPPDRHTRSGHVCWNYYLICDPEEVVGVAINWLREEHDIFYTPGMKVEDNTKDVFDKDIFDTPRYRFLSILSSELGFRTIVGPGNADKTEDDILRVVKHLLAIKQKYDGTSCAYDKRIDMLCREYNVAPCGEDDIALKIDYIFGVLDEWRNRALKAEEEKDAIYKELGLFPGFNDTEDVLASIKRLHEDRAKFKGMLNTAYGAHSVDWSPSSEKIAADEVKAYRTALRELYFATVGSNPDNRSNPSSMKSVILQQFKEKDAAFKAVCDEDDIFRKRIHEAEQKLSELRAKIREVYRGVFSCGMEDHYSYVAALDDILKDYNFVKQLKEKAEEKAVSYKTELNKCREYILTVYREIFDCSNGDPEGSDKENLNDILEEYRRVVSNFEERTVDWYQVKNSLSNLKRQYEDEVKLVSSVRAERDSNKAKYLVFLDKLAKVLDVSYSNPNYIPAKEQDILRAVGTLKTSFDGASEELEDLTIRLNDSNRAYDTSSSMYGSAVKLLGEYLTEAKDILGIDSCTKEDITKAIKDLKSAYNNLRNDYDEVCEGYAKLQEDYDKLNGAYKVVVEWNNAYDELRSLLGLGAAAKAETLIAAVKMLRNAKNRWHERYESEHERANGEHKRAEKCFGEIAALRTQVASLERSLNAAANEQVGVEAFRNECRKLKAEKAKVIKALGQDIWDSCVE